MTASTRDTVVAAARELFARRGYTATTIKDVAAAAGCSPALVMKLTGSKAELFALADPSATVLDDQGAAAPPTETEPIGYELVRRLLDRREHDEPEPFALAPLLVHEAADREATRADIEARYLGRMAERIGDTTPDRTRTQLVLAAMLGLAAAVRTLELLGPDRTDREEVVRSYGAVVQSLVDG